VITPKRPPAPTPDSEYEPSPDSDRPTVLPPFDPAAFARDSEMRQRVAAPATGETTIEEARRLLAQGQPEESLVLLSRLLAEAPLHLEASTLAAECSDALERECWSAIGSGRSVLVVAASTAELKGLGLERVSAFLLSLMDGVTDVESLIDICGVPKLLALRHLRALLARGIIAKQSRPLPQW
jgi:hypothetical protein